VTVQTETEMLDLLIHSPADCAHESISWVRKCQASPGITWHNEAIDKIVHPLYGGDGCGIMGRPGAGKTAVMLRSAKNESDIIEALELKECVVFLSWDQRTTDLWDIIVSDPSDGFTPDDVSWGRVSVEQMSAAAVHRTKRPIFFIGHSHDRTGKNIPTLTLPMAHRAIERIYDRTGLQPRVMYLDFVQCIPVDKHGDQRDMVAEAVMQTKQLGQKLGIPFFLGSQASRRTDQRTPPIPEQSDFEWSSRGEQFVDDLFSLWYPLKTHGIGATVKVGKEEYTVTENLYFIALLKQRRGIGHHLFPCHFSPAELKIIEWEKRFPATVSRSSRWDEKEDQREDYGGGGGRR
jgi:replicative DNA helicase